MNSLEEWQKLVIASLKGQDFPFSKKMGDGTNLQSLYLKKPYSLELPEQRTDFCSILSFSSEAMTGEFLREPSSAVFCSDWTSFEEFCNKTSFKKLFLGPALWPALEKWELLESHIEKWSELHLGWDLWAKGLPEGRLCRWSDDEFSFKLSSLLDNEKVTAFRFSSSVYSLAGAHSIQELGILLATAVEALKRFSGEKSLQELTNHMTFELSMGTQPFQNIAKIQAMQLLWQKFLTSLELKSQAVDLFARPSLRHLSSREPWNNIMRMSLMNFSAMAGGARGFFHTNYDCYSPVPKDDGHIARNISLILEKESGLLEAVKPALGSGYVDSLTEQYCEKAWSYFQEIESKGGLLESLLSGWLQKEISVSHGEEVKTTLSGERRIIGANSFVGLKSLSEQYPFIKKSKSIDELCREFVGEPTSLKSNEIQPLRLQQLSQLFEIWQQKSDKLLEKRGARPHITIFCQDEKAFKDRIEWLKNQLAAGGIVSQVVSKGEDVLSPIVFCLGYDPEEKKWSDQIKKWQEGAVKEVVWFGEKSNSNFKNIIHRQTDPMELYSKVYGFFLEEL